MLIYLCESRWFTVSWVITHVYGYGMPRYSLTSTFRRSFGKSQMVRMATGLGIPSGVYGIMAGIGFPFEGLMWSTAVCFCILGWRVVADDRLDGFAGVSALLVLVEFSALFFERHQLVAVSPALYALLLGLGLAIFALLRFPLFQAIAEDFLDEGFFPEILRQSPSYSRGWRMINLGWAGLFIFKAALLFSGYTAFDDARIRFLHTLMGWPFLAFLVVMSIWFIRAYWHGKKLWMR